jgi:hypothetical protein
MMGISLAEVSSKFTLIVKAIYPIYARALMIASQNEKVFRIFDLVCE